MATVKKELIIKIRKCMKEINENLNDLKNQKDSYEKLNQIWNEMMDLKKIK